MFTNEELSAISDIGTHALAAYELLPKLLRLNNQSLDIVSMTARTSAIVMKARGILQDNLAKEAAEKKAREEATKKGDGA